MVLPFPVRSLAVISSAAEFLIELGSWWQVTGKIFVLMAEQCRKYKLMVVFKEVLPVMAVMSPLMVGIVLQMYYTQQLEACQLACLPAASKEVVQIA